jgi:hypothetical protein
MLNEILNWCDNRKAINLISSCKNIFIYFNNLCNSIINYTLIQTYKWFIKFSILSKKILIKTNKSFFELKNFQFKKNSSYLKPKHCLWVRSRVKKGFCGVGFPFKNWRENSRRRTKRIIKLNSNLKAPGVSKL